MRKIREILRLKWECGLSLSKIGESCDLSKSAVGDCLKRAEMAGVTWPLPDELDDRALEARLYATGVKTVGTLSTIPPPDWAEAHMELKKKGVTRMLLWQEWRATQPDCVSYSRYCELYDEWSKKQRLSMRQVHKAGERLFVDYAGATIPVVDAKTGEVRAAQIFVAVWGASNFAFAEASWSQDLPSWISSHVSALEYFGCVPEITTPDNLKSGVTKACRYDPDLNPTYGELASHYGFAIIPARARKPKDKAKAEAGVLLVTRWIIAALRKRKFFSLAELNEAVLELLERLNDKPFQKMPGSRRSVFESLDRPAAKPLPEMRYVYAEVLKARVNIDYHVAVDDHFYSVPYQLRGEEVKIRLTINTVEILFKNRRIYAHRRSYKKWDFTTIAEHMPEAHKKHLEWTPVRIVSWAATIGKATAEVAAEIIRCHAHPEQGYRSCLGLIRLGDRYGKERLEEACKRAITFRAYRYKSVKSILEKGLDRGPPDARTTADLKPIHHSNIRGGAYYKTLDTKGTAHDDQRNDREAADAPACRDGQGPGGATGLDDGHGAELRGEGRPPGGAGGDRADEPPVGKASPRG